MSSIKKLKEAGKTSVFVSLESWQAQQDVDEITNSFAEAKEIEEAIEGHADKARTDDEIKAERIWDLLTNDIVKESIDSLKNIKE